MHKTIMLALSAALLAAVASCSGVRAPAPDYQAKGPIEQSFQMRGPWQVTRTNSGAACTSSGLTCEIWMPDTAGPRPVIAWANGTGQMPEVYAEFLDHLASWGFVVIAPRDSATGNGQTVQEAAEYIIRQGETPASPYHGRINPARMAALGHSQGATSVTALHIRNTPIFRTYMAYHISPGWFARWCCGVDQASYAGAASRASIFHWTSAPDSGRPDWYEPVRGVSKAYARLRHAGHAAIADAPLPYKGYSTAWLMWQLNGDRHAERAFEPGGEFFNENHNWDESLGMNIGPD